jgi:hypothetical protein
MNFQVNRRSEAPRTVGIAGASREKPSVKTVLRSRQGLPGGVSGFFDATLDWAAKLSFFTVCHVDLLQGYDRTLWRATDTP